MQIGGPIWSAEIHCPDFVGKMKAQLRTTRVKAETGAEGGDSTTTSPAPFTTFGTYRRMEGILEVVSEEAQGCPLYYHLDRLCALARVRMPPMAVVRSAFLSGGYHISHSHAHKNSLKTNAPNEYLWAVVQALVKREAEETGVPGRLKEDEPAWAILSKDFGYGDTISLEVMEGGGEGAVPASKRANLLRYQINPEYGWGPKARPDNEQRCSEKRLSNQGRKWKKKVKLLNGTAATIKGEQQATNAELAEANSPNSNSKETAAPASGRQDVDM